MKLNELARSDPEGARPTASSGFPPKTAEIITLASMTTLAIDFPSGPFEGPESFFLRHPCFLQDPPDV